MDTATLIDQEGHAIPEEEFQSPEGDYGHCNMWFMRAASSGVPFQSPEGDYGHCNDAVGLVANVGVDVSIPRRGLWTLQPSLPWSDDCARGVSIPRRGLWTLQLSGPQLSLSGTAGFNPPKGIMDTATYATGRRRKASARFQSPEGDYGHCNVTPQGRLCGDDHRFNPPKGIMDTATNELLARILHRRGFNPPKGIMDTATSKTGNTFMAWRKFQSPEGDYGHCNLFDVEGADPRIVLFQSPEGDYGHCNRFSAGRRARLAGVSIPRRGLWTLQLPLEPPIRRMTARFNPPKGIMDTATDPLVCQQATTERFQSPEGDYGHCNSREARANRRSLRVSIPRRGLWTLQRPHSGLCLRRSAVSIPRRGLWTLQLVRNLGKLSNVGVFQSPEGDYGHCNRALTARHVQADQVSIPRRGLWTLQQCPAARPDVTVKFQSPEGDYGHCNDGEMVALLMYLDVSIPRRGLWTLQQPGAWGLPSSSSSFNPPKGIMDTATQSTKTIFRSFLT